MSTTDGENDSQSSSRISRIRAKLSACGPSDRIPQNAWIPLQQLIAGCKARHSEQGHEPSGRWPLLGLPKKLTYESLTWMGRHPHPGTLLCEAKMTADAALYVGWAAVHLARPAAEDARVSVRLM